MPSPNGRAVWVWIALILGLVATVSGQFVHGHEARAGAFFGAGAMFLTAGLLQFRRWLRAHDRGRVRPARSIAEVGRRNVARHPGRSLLTAGLLAAAAFLLVSVESFRRQPAANFAEKSGGSGGYDFVATLDIPLNYDPGISGPGRQELLDSIERQYQKDPATKEQRLRDAAVLLEGSTLIPLRVHSGDDAGCRNLARPDKPRLIGITTRFIDRGGFPLTVPDMPADLSNPWTYLVHNPKGIAAFGEANTIQWTLKTGVGKRFPVLDSHGTAHPLAIAGTLQDSIFQGELLLAEYKFLELFPETTGYSMLVASAPPGRAEDLRQLLESACADRGLATTRAIDRVAPYLAVENTYLSTFQVLGGLGLLLGACGLAVVLLRSAVERRGELALLRAVGWPLAGVQSMLRTENRMLAMVGLGLGTVAALAGIAPLLVTGEASLRPLVRVAILLIAAVLMAGVMGRWATRAATRASIIPALRRE
jgi:hypothetical protein